MAALSEDVKRFIVQALACFDTTAQVVESVKEEFGLLVLLQLIFSVHCMQLPVDQFVVDRPAFPGYWARLFEAGRSVLLCEIDCDRRGTAMPHLAMHDQLFTAGFLLCKVQDGACLLCVENLQPKCLAVCVMESQGEYPGPAILWTQWGFTAVVYRDER
jgi:hypothetical protein